MVHNNIYTHRHINFTKATKHIGNIFVSNGLTAWYGAKLIIDKGYEGGQVVSVLMAFMTGAM